MCVEIQWLLSHCFDFMEWDYDRTICEANDNGGVMLYLIVSQIWAMADGRWRYRVSKDEVNQERCYLKHVPGGMAIL